MTEQHAAYTRTQNERIAKTINNYWRSPVAKVNNHNEVLSSLHYGVPRHARHSAYTHEAIIRVHRAKDGKWMVIK